MINTTKPTAPETLALVNSLEEKYQVSVIALDVLNMTENDMDHLLKVAMDEFDISELNLEVPTWVNKLDDDISYKTKFNDLINQTTGTFRKMKDAFRIQDTFKNSELFADVNISNIDPGTGLVNIEITCSDECYNDVVSEI